MCPVLHHSSRRLQLVTHCHTWSAEVWDKDFVRTAQGSDDFLGRLRLPMVDLLRNREAELSQRLEDSTCSSKACLVLGVWFLTMLTMRLTIVMLTIFITTTFAIACNCESAIKCALTVYYVYCSHPCYAAAAIVAMCHCSDAAAGRSVEVMR